MNQPKPQVASGDSSPAASPAQRVGAELDAGLGAMLSDGKCLGERSALTREEAAKRTEREQLEAQAKTDSAAR